MAVCNKATEKCNGCHHAIEHDWALNCISSPCTHFSFQVCDNCEDKETCGTSLYNVPVKKKDHDGVTMDVMEEQRMTNVRDPRRKSPTPHFHCMRCEKFAAASIAGVKCG